MVQDCFFVQRGHGCGCWSCSEEGGGDLVHLFVSALGAEQNRDQKGERIAVVERDWGFWIGLLKALEDPLGTFAFLQPRPIALRADPRAASIRGLNL